MTYAYHLARADAHHRRARAHMARAAALRFGVGERKCGFCGREIEHYTSAQAALNAYDQAINQDTRKARDWRAVANAARGALFAPDRDYFVHLAICFRIENTIDLNASDGSHDVPKMLAAAYNEKAERISDAIRLLWSR
jgi:hypothetical protein